MTESTRTDPSARILPIAPGGEVEFRLSSHDLRIRAVDGDQVTLMDHPKETGGFGRGVGVRG